MFVKPWGGSAGVKTRITLVQTGERPMGFKGAQSSIGLVFSAQYVCLCPLLSYGNKCHSIHLGKFTLNQKSITMIVFSPNRPYWLIALSYGSFRTDKRVRLNIDRKRLPSARKAAASVFQFNSPPTNLRPLPPAVQRLSCRLRNGRRLPVRVERFQNGRPAALNRNRRPHQNAPHRLVVEGD